MNNIDPIQELPSKPTILVTGGAGYIGSHAVLALKNSGYEVIVLDNLSYGHPELVTDVLKVQLIVGDTNDRPLLDQLFSTYNIAAVMQFELLACCTDWQPDQLKLISVPDH